MGNLCSKFGKNRPTNYVTFLSTDAGRTDGRLRDFIVCPMHMHSIGQTTNYCYYSYSYILTVKYLLLCCEAQQWVNPDVSIEQKLSKFSNSKATVKLAIWWRHLVSLKCSESWWNDCCIVLPVHRTNGLCWMETTWCSMLALMKHSLHSLWSSSTITLSKNCVCLQTHIAPMIHRTSLSLKSLPM